MARRPATACRRRCRRVAGRSQPRADPVGRAGQAGRARRRRGDHHQPDDFREGDRIGVRLRGADARPGAAGHGGWRNGAAAHRAGMSEPPATCCVATAARTGGRDGRVSIEVDPRIAQDAARTAAEARGLWWLVDRPNLFIKIPATLAGLPAITETLAAGISVNVTLIFSVERYRAVLDAFLSGLEQRLAGGGSLEGLESVASFFVSRIDVEVDRRLDAMTR